MDFLNFLINPFCCGCGGIFLLILIFTLYEAREVRAAQERKDNERLENDRKTRAREEARMQALRISDVDAMSGLQFEHYVARLLRHQGCQNVVVSKGSGDFGIDITANWDDRLCAIQVKRQESKVSRRAISDAVAGKAHFGCDEAMVITNSHFSKSAQEIARSTGCELVDRDLLTDWIVKFQASTALPPSSSGPAP